MRVLKFLGLLMLFASAVSAEPDWVLKKDKDGIRVYSAKVSNSGFRAVKAECTVNATLSQMAALLSDIGRHNEWVYSVKSARILQVISPAEFIYYSEVDAPWPCSNRDFVINFKMAQPSPGVLTIDSHVETGIYPEQPGIVRVKYSVTHWNITAVNDSVKVEYTIRFDPGGSVPAWIVNMFISDGPYKTFKKMKERAKMAEYRDAHYDFIKDHK